MIRTFLHDKTLSINDHASLLREIFNMLKSRLLNVHCLSVNYTL